MIRKINLAPTALALMLAYPAQAQTTASRIGDFLNTLGINGHIASNVTPYLQTSGVVADAQYLGIRYWRDGLGAQASWQIAPLRALVNAGLSLVGIPLQNQAITVSDHISKAKVWATLGPNALYALEGPNEPGNFPITYKGVSTGPTTFLPAAQFQRDYYAAIKSDAILKHLPVLSVTLGGAEPNNVGLQYLTIPTPLPSGVRMPAGTVYADFANIHSYPMYDVGAQTIDQTADRIQITYHNNFVQTYARHYLGYTDIAASVLPKVITEFGYPATGGTPGGYAVDIPTQGKNILTGLFNAWTEGYSLVALYDLYDEGDGFGIFYDAGRPKASATYLHNLTAVLADNGFNAQSFNPASLTYSFDGLPSSGNAFLFQKSNGNFELVVWNDVANWDVSAGTPVAIAPLPVTVTLALLASGITVYDPTTGTLPVQSLTNTTTVTISLSDYPLIIEIGNTNNTCI